MEEVFVEIYRDFRDRHRGIVKYYLIGETPYGYSRRDLPLPEDFPFYQRDFDADDQNAAKFIMLEIKAMKVALEVFRHGEIRFGVRDEMKLSQWLI